MTIKVKLAAIAKDEAAYIPQWIHHHIFFGFDEIEIWLNNTTDNSVTLLTEIQALHPKGKVKFRVVDELLQKCLSENLQFQQICYAEIYNQALKDGEHSHILFLDLDEFWVPQDFTSSVIEFITSAPESDAISFQWLIDAPDVNRHLFCSPFSYANPLQKNRHVKTLTKVTSRMRELSVHNHIIEDGKYTLASGSSFPGSDRETINKSLVPVSYHKINGGVLEKAFVLHQINRTPIEYMSSLLRGRGHKNDDSTFKANRIGYIFDSNSAPVSNFKVDVQRIIAYDESLAKYSSTVSGQLLLARNFIIERFFAAVQKIQDNTELLATYRDQLRGVRINDLICVPIRATQTLYSVDKTRVVASQIIIEGWAFDALSGQRPSLSVELENGSPVSTDVFYHERPDVIKIYPDAIRECGFKITVSAFEHQTVKLSIKTSGGSETVVIATDSERSDSRT